MKAGTNLEKVLEANRFAVTAEVGPPKGAGTAGVMKKGEKLRDFTDALNVTDNQTAIVRMCSLAGCTLLKRVGVDPVLQMVVRDRNRIALQSDILGAVALGIGNILCLSGDYQSFGNHPTAKGVYDLDSVQLIYTLKTMRDEHKFLCGEAISGEMGIFIGAVENPFADPFEYRVLRLARKVRAGVDFIQTQAVFDVGKFKRWMNSVKEYGLSEQAHVLAGIIPVKSAGMARYMRDYVSGVAVPDEMVTRLEQAGDVKEEGLKIALEIVEQIMDIPEVHGIHIMAVGWEEIVPMIVEQSGLLPRPEL
ncbi:MAG: methylenetetrahydrofolate reductase [Syntrophobacteraceae bacterium]